jgi:hypothetical protein
LLFYKKKTLTGELHMLEDIDAKSTLLTKINK